MPHYHNFGWYYFLKYVVGFAGMLFLYTGFLKERGFGCVCAAEDRERARHKGENNESSPTGGTTDARAKRDLMLRNRVRVDADEYTPMPATGQTEAGVSASPTQIRRSKFATNRGLQVYRSQSASHSSSDGNFEVQRRKRHRPDCRRALRHRRAANWTKSSRSLRSVARLGLECEENCDRRLIDAVARANLRVRDSIAKQEHLELEAFACFVVNQGIEPNFSRKIAVSSSSSIPSSFRAEENYASYDDSDDGEIYTSDNVGSPYYREIDYGAPIRRCRRHFPESPSTSFASMKSRSGSVYFTASSRGKTLECKVHGRRCFKSSDNPGRWMHRCRITEESDESETVPHEELTVDARRIGSRRAIRWRSRCN